MRRRLALTAMLAPPVWATAGDVPLAVGEHSVVARWQTVLSHVAQRVGVRWQYQPLPWVRAQAFAETGQGLMFGLGRTPERETRFVFSRPVVTVQTWVVVREADQHTFGDGLAQRSACMARGSAYPGVFADLGVPVGRWVEVNQGNPAALRMLQAQRCDAAVLSLPGPDSQAVKQRLEGYGMDASGLAVLPRPITQAPLHFVTGHRSPWLPLLQRIDEVLRKDRARLDRLAREVA